MSKKILIIAIVIVVAILGFAALYLLTNNKDGSSDTQSSDAPAVFEASAPNELEPAVQQEPYEYTDTIISPNTIANNPNEYVGRTITTRGWVNEISPNEYLLLSTNIDELYGLQLSATGDIDFSKYTDSSGGQYRGLQTVNLTGELTISEVSNTLVFLVSSLTE